MITVLGSINLDLIATAPRLPVPGESLIGDGFVTAPGGKGANQALAAHRAGAQVRLVGAVGTDEFADLALAELTADGPDLSAVARAPGATGIAVILVDARGENVIVVVPAANMAVDAGAAGRAVAAMAPGDTLVVQQEVPPETIAAALDAAAARGLRTVLNTAPVIAETAALAARAGIVVANETELAALAGDPRAAEAPEGAARAWAAATGRTLIVTLGAKGALVATPEGAEPVPALPVTPVDTVGAGDTFCGYLAARLDAGDALTTAARHAAAAASLACLKPGAQPAIPHAAEVAAALGAD